MTVQGNEVEVQYRALRQGLGAFRPDRDVVSVGGPDAVAYLQGQCSQDVASLDVGASAPGLLLAPDGKLEVLVRVSRTGPDRFVLDTDGGFGERVVARLARFRLRTKVEIEQLAWGCLALRGDAGAAAAAARTAAAGLVRAAFSWNGWKGVDLLGPASELAVPEGAVPCTLPAWRACLVESGVPVMGRELDERTIAAEAHLVEDTVSFTKGCYTGQELVARLDARGSRVARQLRGVVVEPATPAEALEGAELRVPGRDRPVGTVTSAAWCPGIQAPAALAYVHRSVEVPGTVEVLLERPGAAGSEPGTAPTTVTGQVLQLPLV